MKNLSYLFINYLISQHKYVKRLIIISTDVILCVLCAWLAYVLRLEEIVLFKDFNIYSALISIFIAIPVFWAAGLYRTIYRYTGTSIILTILNASFFYGLIYFTLIVFIGVKNVPNYIGQSVPRSIGVLQPMLLFFAIICFRLSIKFILQNFIIRLKPSKTKVIIYGAGNAGRQLLVALENSPEYEVIGFIDDNYQLHRQIILGKFIYSPSNLKNLIKTKNLSLILLALPTISRDRRNKIIEELNRYKLAVKTLPSISEIIDGRITISDIKDLNIDDLLNREQVKPDKILLNKNINSKTVLVTGAGGSIGSELCRQIVKLKPNMLIIIELNEFSLYKIFEELIPLNKNLKIVPLLTNTQEQSKLELIFEKFNVHTIYHAAAYKHVPLVEENVCEGVKNNVFSTLAITKASINKKVSNLVLISSDKAVRPTNIMGATKRLSELYMQSIYNHNKDINTNFAIVRFGNVLESSGSVIPKFKRQIKEGGPITLTHQDVTRYFMTITEAAQLVIQAGAMGKNSEVFILDMGSSVKIKDLIHKMINLSGLTVRDNNNPDGDIAIDIIGLRPGEKLYEELLIGDDPQNTDHPKIKKTNDSFIPFFKLQKDLETLQTLLTENNVKKVKELLERIVNSYKSNSKIIDHLYNQEITPKKNEDNLSFDRKINYNKKKIDHKVIKLIK
jgi:FlaA1/EpsC-like NDP-sugar epimerase